MNYDVAVIGGGASGLACAVRLTEKSELKIVVIDAGERLGKKLSATGNGQGNISNTDLSPEHYFGGGAYLAQKIACNDPYACTRLFDCILTADEKGRIYPAGRQASSLSDCLIRKLKGKADIIQGVKVTDMERGFKLTLSDGTKLFARFIAFCVGGKAQKQYKTDGSSYALVSRFGHKVTRLFPSLVQVKTQTKYIKSLKGIRADCNASAVVGGKKIKTVRGDVIFTDYGVSGNAIFSLSPYITDKTDSVISLEFLPDVSEEDIVRNFERRKNAGCATGELLSGSLHNQLGRAVISRAETEDKIIQTLKNFTLSVEGTLGFDYAQVTRGGIDISGVKDNLESKFIDNLFFAGEVLDVDGDCGGYNLQWAFTSGMTVAEEIIKRT
ncbi:MAG: aminoacetone oxidase family FAD-binding enzyme [Clostridia bacterium]|nr:aminoacetone oxidase family FAD-binding enzyme [Clostridia bacterium]